MLFDYPRKDLRKTNGRYCFLGKYSVISRCAFGWSGLLEFSIHKGPRDSGDIKYNDTGQICTFYWIVHSQSRPDYRRKIITTPCRRTASDLATAASKTTPSTKPIRMVCLSILKSWTGFERLYIHGEH